MQNKYTKPSIHWCFVIGENLISQKKRHMVDDDDDDDGKTYVMITLFFLLYVLRCVINTKLL